MQPISGQTIGNDILLNIIRMMSIDDLYRNYEGGKFVALFRKVLDSKWMLDTLCEQYGITNELVVNDVKLFSGDHEMWPTINVLRKIPNQLPRMKILKFVDLIREYNLLNKTSLGKHGEWTAEQRAIYCLKRAPFVGDDDPTYYDNVLAVYSEVISDDSVAMLLGYRRIPAKLTIKHVSHSDRDIWLALVSAGIASYYEISGGSNIILRGIMDKYPEISIPTLIDINRKDDDMVEEICTHASFEIVLKYAITVDNPRLATWILQGMKSKYKNYAYPPPAYLEGYLFDYDGVLAGQDFILSVLLTASLEIVEWVLQNSSLGEASKAYEFRTYYISDDNVDLVNLVEPYILDM